MGAEHFEPDILNGRRLPVWRLAVCRQLVVLDFLLRCRESGEIPPQVPTFPFEE